MTAGPGNKSYVFDWMSCDKADVDVFCVIIGKGDKTCQVFNRFHQIGVKNREIDVEECRMTQNVKLLRFFIKIV